MTANMSQPMQVFMSRATAADPERDEAGTPPHIIAAARQVLGGIDLDPATSAVYAHIVKSAVWYDRAMDGLRKPWFGRVWLNPPFAETQRWIERLEAEYARPGGVQAAALLVNSNLGYIWFEELWRRRPVCLLRERLVFVRADGTPHAGPAKKAQTIAYYGSDVETFARTFAPLGRVILPCAPEEDEE